MVSLAGIVLHVLLLLLLAGCAVPHSQPAPAAAAAAAEAPPPPALERPELVLPPEPAERTPAETWREVLRRTQALQPMVRDDIAAVRPGPVPDVVRQARTAAAAGESQAAPVVATDSAGAVGAVGAEASFPVVDVATNYTTASGLPSNRVTAIYVGDEDAWVGTADQGVARLNFAEGNWLVTRTEDGLAGNRVTDIAVYQDRVFVGTQDGISIWDGLSWNTLTEVGKVQLLNCLMVERDGVLWVAARAMRGGLVTFDGEKWKDRSTLRKGTVLNNVSDFAFQGKALWIGTTNRGVYQFDGAGWSSHTVAQGIASNFVYTLVVTPTKCLLGGCCGLSVFEDGEWIIYDIAEGLPHSTVNAMAADGELVWIGSKNGLAMFDGLDFVVIDDGDGLADNRVTSLFVKGNQVWVGTADGLTVLETSY